MLSEYEKSSLDMSVMNY